jgi:hypothetical protein
MYAQIFATGQTQAGESLLLFSLFFRLCSRYAVFHQSFQLGKSFLDLRDSSRTVDEFAFHGEKLGIEDSLMVILRRD